MRRTHAPWLHHVLQLCCRSICLFTVLFAMSGMAITHAADVRLEQVISRESPLFRCQSARMTVGRDGFVYLTSDSQGKGFCLRLSRDGQRKLGGEVIYAIHNATANAEGQIVTANAHFNHSLNLYDNRFQKVGAVDDFLVNDQVGWDAPSHVEAGASNEFYGIDQHRNRVIRVGIDGKVKAVYPVRADHETDWGKPTDFRLNESLKSFYWLVNGQLIRTGLDGATIWKIPTPVQYRWDVGSYGGFDVDEAGIVYWIEGQGDAVQRRDAAGQSLSPIKLDMGDLKPTATASIVSLRVWKDEVVIRRASPTELFQVYDLKTGQRKHLASIDHELLTLTFPSLAWTTGERLPITINFHTPAGRSPKFRVWITPFGISDWRELPRDGESRITVPEEYAGLYQLKVTPEVTPRQTDEASEYLVREIIEVRRPNSRGSVAVVTPHNRMHYSATEAIRGRVIARTAEAIRRTDARLRNRQTNALIASQTIELTKTASSNDLVGEFHFEPKADLVPGDYQLEVVVPELTCVGQRLVIGPGVVTSLLRHMLYGDYGLTSPQRNAWESADSASAHTERMRKLGINQFANRTQQLSLDFPNDDNGRGLLNRIKQRLQADPVAVTPEKAEFGSAHHQIAEIYSASGWREFLILIYMDGGLPLGTGHDRRTPEQFAKTIRQFTEALWSYPSFTGWAWVANWWLYEPNAKFTSTEERTAYETAVKAAQTGPWDPIIDRVDDRKYKFAVDAQAQFHQALERTNQSMMERNAGTKRSLLTATAGPYRRPEVLPEMNFANVNEIDVHYQAEQITTPDWVPHGIDVSKRFGQPTWIHPELWNDFGTGDQILPASWLAIARGADGIGTSGNIPNWSGASMESRLAYHGTVTTFRSLHRAVEDLTIPLTLVHQAMQPWKDSDRIGIVVSPRQQKLETFGHGLGSPTFSRQFEAYQSFLYANCSARFVSLEEVQQRFLAKTKEVPADLRLCFDALLLVGQTVELEPEWQTFLKQAKTAGVRILADGTCRKERCPEAEPLGVSFDVIEKEHSVNSDYAHYVYPERFVANAHALAPLIQAVKSKSRRPRDIVTVRPAGVLAEATESQQPVVLVHEYDSVDQGRIVFVVNNTPSSLSPGLLRKVGRAISTRAPVVAALHFELTPDQKVIDLFSNQEVSKDANADLRDAHARLYWVGTASQHQALGLPTANAPRGTPNGPRPDQSFGPHLRDIAVSADGSTALLNAFNGDHNLYGVDLATGAVRFRNRIADHFAYSPVGTASNFYVQGFDFRSAEGYHLYAINRDGSPARRFALPGIPGCLTGWAFTAWIQDHVNNFTTPVTGDWVAAAGNLGLAVWNRDGRLLWSDDWSRTTRRTLSLCAIGADTLISANGMTVIARRATTGESLWNVMLANSGDIQGLHPSADGKTLAVRTSNAGGRVFLLRDGQIVGQLPTPADDLSLSADGQVIAVTTGHQLKVFMNPATNDAKLPSSLNWLAHGDDQLRFPKVSPDGRRMAVCSELGTLTVYAADGTMLHQRDEFGVVTPAWLGDGDLLLASWMGWVTRLDANYQDRWRTHVRAGENIVPSLASTRRDRHEALPTSRLTSWEAAKNVIPERPNLLAPNQFIARLMMGDQASEPARPVNDLADGKTMLSPTPTGTPDGNQTKPWLSWYDHGMIESGWRGEFSLVIDSFNKQLRIDSITFVEDGTHPESWLRDMRCEYWDADAERWVFADYLTSNSSVHSHTLKQPIEAARIRFTKADGHAWPAGNIRLQELMLHGQVLGGSHPDVVAKRPVAVLFDENVVSIKGTYEHGHNPGLKFATGAEAFAGGNYLALPADRQCGPLWQPPYGHMTPNWWFEVVENPQPGQYRYLQFTVKSLSPETKGVTVRVAPAHYAGIAIALGEPTKSEGAVIVQESAAVPLQWQTITIDLWKHLPENQRGKPFNIGAMNLGTVGGPAAIDRIRLGRTLEDLDK